MQALGVEALYHPYVSDPVAWLREHGAALDAIMLSRHYVAVNYIGAARLYAPQARLIFDTVDLHYLREERAAANSKASPNSRAMPRRPSAGTQADARMRRHARRQRGRADACSRSELPNARIEVLSQRARSPRRRRKPFAERRDLVFVGGFQHPPNIDAVRWFVARGHAAAARARRRAASARHRQQGAAEVLELAGDGVIVHGYVPDIAPFMDGCRLSVAPLRYGAGVKGKVNMAMSYGLPVVATATAVEGMHVRAGVDVDGRRHRPRISPPRSCAPTTMRHCGTTLSDQRPRQRALAFFVRRGTRGAEAIFPN